MEKFTLTKDTLIINDRQRVARRKDNGRLVYLYATLPPNLDDYDLGVEYCDAVVRVELSHDQLVDICRRATKNISKRATQGPITAKVVSGGRRFVAGAAGETTYKCEVR